MDIIKKTIKIQVLSIFLLFASLNIMAAQSDHFVTTWKTDNQGFSNDSSITIGTNGGGYSYSVDWDNDNIVDETGLTGDASHDYGTPGTYTVRIFGDFPQLFMGPTLDGSKMIAIEQWGTNPWVSMEGAFSGADNLVNNATDTPDLSNVLSLKSMFINAAAIGSSSETADWDWDTSSVQSMEHMFSGALAFDQDISSWNVENVINFENMFNEATLSTPNYEALLISWAAQNINNLLVFDGGFSQYCSQAARTARNSLIFNDGLSFTDGGLCEEGYFITTWKTDNPGTSNSTSITIPTEDSEIYSYQVDWNGDGDFDDTDENINYSGNATHDYGTAGTYTVKIKGIFPRIHFNNGGDKEKILTLEQWGTKTWTSMKGAFWGARFLKMNAQDIPDLSVVESLFAMFAHTNNLGSSIGSWNWDTSNINDMESAFVSSGFDFDISNWNVQNISTFSFVFNLSSLSTENYDKILSTWWTQNLQSNVGFGTNQTEYCSQAAQDGRASIIANYNWIFNDAGLDPNCDTSVLENHFVITVDTENTGSSGPASFSIPTTGTGYNYSVDTNNDGVFEFTGITGPWTINFDTAGINTIRIAGDFPRIYFNESGDKDKILSIEQWGTTRWVSMNNAFSGASNLVVNATDTPNLSDVSSLFRMFKDATNIGNGSGNWNWDTSNITGMAQTFQNAINFDKDISSWNIENVTNVGGMFTGANLSNDNYDALLIAWDAQNVNPSLAFNGGNSQYCSQNAIDARENLINSENWTIADGGRNQACVVDNDSFIITFKTDNPGTSDDDSFTIPTEGLGYNYDIDFNNDGVFDFINKSGDFTIQYNALGAGTYTIRIRGDFPRIYFNNAGDKEKILSIEQWGNNPWLTMNGAFNGAINLVNNATDTPNLSNVLDMNYMFYNATNIGLGAGNWNWITDNVEQMTSMYLGATSFNEDISSWNTSNVQYMNGMFKDAVSFNQNISLWNVESVMNFTNMFDGVQLSTNNYDALLISWDSQTLSQNITFNGGNSKYCSIPAQSSRLNLINNDLWNITDGGLDSACNTITNIDLSLEITSAVNSVHSGALIDYIVQINNVGASDVLAANIDDVLPVEISESTWICDATGVAVCPNNGMNNINSSVDIPVGDSVTFTVSATLIDDLFEQVEYMAEVTANVLQNDTDLSNNSDTFILVNNTIFRNGFEIPPVVVRTLDGYKNYDFTQITKTEIGIVPVAIVKGEDENKNTNLWIHIRQFDGDLQIRLSTRYSDESIWQIGEWQTFESDQITILYW